MTNHKHWLDTGLPDLSASANSWLDSVQDEGEDGPRLPLDVFGDTFIEQMRAQLYENSGARPPGLSDSGSCSRKITYKANGAEPVAPGARSRVTFAVGDTIEWFLLASAINAGWGIEHTIFSDGGQLEVTLSFNGQEVAGHPDGIIDMDPYIILVECKSTKEWLFHHFTNDKAGFVEHIEDDVFQIDNPDHEGWQFWDGWIKQMHAYGAALKGMYPDRELRMLLWTANKNNSWHKTAEVKWNERVWQNVREQWEIIAERWQSGNLAPVPPEVKGEIDGQNQQIKYPCGYCGFWKECLGERFPDAERVTEEETGKQKILLNKF